MKITNSMNIIEKIEDNEFLVLTVSVANDNGNVEVDNPQVYEEEIYLMNKEKYDEEVEKFKNRYN